MALVETPERSASSSWVSERDSRRRRRASANPPGPASASTVQTLAGGVVGPAGFRQVAAVWGWCGRRVGGVPPTAAGEWFQAARGRPRRKERP